MKLIKTKINDLLILKSQLYKDKRGFLKETYRKDVLNRNFPFDLISRSKMNVLRGLHFQNKYSQAKLITVTDGKILDVAVDLRKKSVTFGKYFSIVLKYDSDLSLFIPENFAHGFACLSKTCTLYYRCTNYRDKNSEIGIKWNDKDLNINWNIKSPILSKKDNKNLNFKEINF